MSTSGASISVLIGDSYACIKICGRANFTSSIDFKTLVKELQAKGFKCFIIELSECVLMDSTFLGVLTGFGLEMNQPTRGNGDSAIELLNANARITDLLENLGVLHLFKLRQGEFCAPAGAETKSVEPISPSRAEVTQTCLEAHRNLMAANPENVCRFKDVAQFLAEDLKKIKAATQ